MAVAFGEVFVVAVGLIAYALVSRRIEPWPLTMPMVFVGFGALTEAAGLVHLERDAAGVALLAEVTLAVILFSDAVRINVPSLRHDLALPGRLLLVGLPMSIGLTTLLVAFFYSGLSWAEAALIAAILAPTDAALGKAVVDDESVPVRIRQSLNVESGLNDGMVLPAVLLFIALATGEETSAGFWGKFALQQVGLGTVTGLAVGAGGAWLLGRAVERRWIEGIYAQLGTLALAFVAFAGALAAGANGFIATFVAGLTFGAISKPSTADHLDEYTEDTGQLLAVLAFFVFGNVFVGDALGELSGGVILAALAALTVGRILPVAAALVGTGAAWPTRLFLGWFGPRGLASIAFGLLLLEEEIPGGTEMFAIIALTVVASVILHGASAAWGARTYGRWYAATPGHQREAMPEAMAVPPRRRRWSKRPI